MRAILSALAFFCTFSAQAAELSNTRPISECSAFLPFGVPSITKQLNTNLVCREGYALQFDNGAQIPVWVAYELTPKKAVGCYPRTTQFRKDDAVKNSASQKDYEHTHYDIGHMANNSDMRWSEQAEIDSNSMSNVAPQIPGLNRGAWKALEDQTRGLALDRQHKLQIYVGPIYDGSSHLPSTSVVIPQGFYKIIVDQAAGEVYSFVYPNFASSKSPEIFLTSYARVKQLTGIDFKIKFVHEAQEFWSTKHKSNRTAKEKACSLP